MAQTDIGNTILAQLGGRRFIAMTGAHSFSTNGNDLIFKIGHAVNANGKRVNGVQIKLNSVGLYDMKFMFASVRGVTVVATENDVYFDQLQNLFEKHTGLYTHL